MLALKCRVPSKVATETNFNIFGTTQLGFEHMTPSPGDNALAVALMVCFLFYIMFVSDCKIL